MRNVLSVLFLLLLHPVFSQDCGWMSPSVGISGTRQSAMFRGAISLTYLRNNRFGFTIGGEANGRVKAFRRAKSLQSFENSYLCFTWNVRPYEDLKLLLRTGVSTGSYRYLDEYLGTVEYPTSTGLFTKTEEKYASTTTKAWGCYLSFETLINANGDNSALGFEVFTHISRYWIAGAAIRLNFGAL